MGKHHFLSLAAALVVIGISVNLGAETMASVPFVAFVEMKAASEVMTGEAHFKNGDFAYTETHTLTSREGHLASLVTEYRGKPKTPELREPSSQQPSTEFGPAEAPIIALMRHEFTAPGFLPDYRFEDLRLKVVDRLKVDWTERKISIYRKDGEKEKEGTLKLEDGMITGQGVYFWVVANLDTILKGEKIRVKFVVPAKIDSYPFVAKLVKTENEKHIIGVSIDNWLFNLFITKLEFDIDAKTHKLLEYRGTSNVADDAGKYRDVIIKFEIPKTQAAL